MSKNTELSIAPQQYELKLEIAAEKEIDGVGTGVLNDGMPFLTLRGLARMCGVDNAQMVRMTAAWQETPLKPREKKIRELVRAQGRGRCGRVYRCNEKWHSQSRRSTSSVHGCFRILRIRSERRE